MSNIFDKLERPARRTAVAASIAGAAVCGILAVTALFELIKAVFLRITVPEPEVISYFDALEGTVPAPPSIPVIIILAALCVPPAVMCALCAKSARSEPKRWCRAAAGICLILVSVFSVNDVIGALRFFPISVSICALLCTVFCAAAGTAAIFFRKNAVISVIGFGAVSVLLGILLQFGTVCTGFYAAALYFGTAVVVMSAQCRENKPQMTQK